MVLLDFSQISHASIHAFSDEIKKSSASEMEGIIRHIILNSILTIRNKFKIKEYGQIVICIDDRQYWRRDIFEYYKANRKAVREASELDWDAIFEVINRLKVEIEENFPYKVIHVPRAEADDIIAVLTKYTQTNELTTVGFEKDPQNVVAVSEDQDFFQLHKYPNYRQWLPRKRKLAKPENLKEFIIEHIVKAGDDGIPNILSADNIFVAEPRERQKTVSAKRLAEFKALGRDACKTDAEKRGWDRNQRLIDFEFIPEDVERSIINTYESCKPTANKGDIFNYLVKNRCRVLLEKVEEF